LQNNLAKFGYILDMKVGKKERKKRKNPFDILGYLLELIIKIWQIEISFFFSKSGKFGGVFFFGFAFSPMKNPCYQNHIPP
jgi:hypothetical protein